MAARKRGSRTPRILNRKARHDYFVLETVEAGMELKGCEVKSLRQGKASLAESFARIADGEVYLYGMHIAPYEEGSYNNPPSRRPRKLLLHRRQIRHLAIQVRGTGYTLVPLVLYFKRGYVKVELGLARGKRLYDKREAIKARDADREKRRALKQRPE